MQVYWLDAGVLIQAERKWYPQAIVPQFWQWIDGQLRAGRVQMPRLAYQEITSGGYDDSLSTWCKNRKELGLCVHETLEVQEEYGRVLAYVSVKWGDKFQQVREFTNGADGWIIASALATGGIVVTSENVRSYKSKIKIPTVAKAFDVTCLDTPAMLKELGADFSKGKA